MARFCNQCNYPIEEGGNFCTECGSNNIRDDANPTPQATEIVPVDNTTQPETTPVNSPIPEIETEAVRSFGDRSIEQIQNASIQSINSSPATVSSNIATSTEQAAVPQGPMIVAPQTVQSTPAPTNSFADVPDYMNGSQEIAIPSNFKLQEGPADDYNQTNLPQKNTVKRVRRKRSKKSDGTFIKIVIGIVIGLVIMFGIIFGSSILKQFTKTSDPFSSVDNGTTENPGGSIDYSTIFTSENSFRVGDPSKGYVSIPKTWAQVAQQTGVTALQYTDGTTWVVTLMSSPTEKDSAVTYANSVYKDIQKGGGKDIKTGKTNIAGYPAFTVSAYYPKYDKYLTTWCFESKIGQTHYLAIEGPSPSGENYNIIYSFKEDK